MPELPDVTQRFIADVIPYLDAMADLIAATEEATQKVEALQVAIDALHGRTIDIKVETTGGTGAGTEAAVAQVRDLAIAWTEEAAAQDAARAGAEAFGREVAQAAAKEEAAAREYTQALIANAEIDRTVIESSAEASAHALETLRAAYRDAFASVDPFTQAEDSLRATLQAADTTVAFHAAQLSNLGHTFLVTKLAADQLNGAVDNANQGWAIQIGWLRLTATALHWIVAGSAEFLAVAVPAAVALGAGLAVAAQGAQNAQQHFTALYAATESTYSAFHQTVGTTLGLGDALQKAQDAANPGVYELLGSAVNDAKSGFSSLASVGLQVVHMFDEFAARVTVDLKSGMGAQIQGLLSGMVTSLQQFGNVLGNLGHALLNFMSAMPGLAHFLLDVAVGISTVIEWASRAGSLLTFAMAMEETFRWGGLLLTMLVRLTGQMAAMNALGATNFATRFGAAIIVLISTLGRAMFAVGAFVAELNILPAVTSRIGAGLAEAGIAVDGFAAALSPGVVVGAVLAAAALVYLLVKLNSMQTATQKWVDASNQAVAKASDLSVLPTIYNQLALTTDQLATSQTHMMRAVTVGKTALGVQAADMQYNSQNAGALASHLMSLVATADTVRSNIGLLAGVFHTSATGALALANAAGVNLQVGLTKGSAAAKIAEQQILNLKQGLGAMAAPAGVVGADMEAVGIQSQLASSKVQTVNQALDSFIGMSTGAVGGAAQFLSALHSMGRDTASTSVGITGAINSISRTAAKMGFTLEGVGPKAQQSWQQFTQAVIQGNSILDTFRTGMAAGVVTAGQYQKEIQAVGGSLLPFAAHNKAALSMVSALAQEAGFPATHSLKTLATQLGITGQAAQTKMFTGAQRAAVGLSNLSTVARNLSATISGQLDAAMAGAIVKASGLDQAYLKWATDVKNTAPAATLKNDLAGIEKAQNFVNTAETKGTTLLNDGAKAATNLGSAYKGVTTGAGAMDTAVKQTNTSLMAHAVNAKSAALASQGFGQQAHTAASAATGLAANANQANTAVRTLGTSANTTRGSLGTVNNEIRTTASAASAAQGPLMGMSNNIRAVGSSAAAAAGQVRALEGAIASLQSKTITLTTNMVTNTIHRAGGGPVAAGIPYTVGEFGQELFVPGVPGYIVPHDQTQQALSPVASPATTAQIGSGTGGGAAVIHTHVYLDGQQIWQNQQQTTLRYNSRNGNRGAGTVSPALSAARG